MQASEQTPAGSGRKGVPAPAGLAPVER